MESGYKVYSPDSIVHGMGWSFHYRFNCSKMLRCVQHKVDSATPIAFEVHDGNLVNSEGRQDYLSKMRYGK